MTHLTIGTTVSIIGTEYTGTIVDIYTEVSPVLYQVELNGDFDELPTDICEWHFYNGTVIWPAYAEEIDTHL